MKCLYCLLQLLEHTTLDATRAKDAITVVAGDACCETHLAEAIMKSKSVDH